MSTPTFTAADFIKRMVEFCGGWGDEAASYLASEMASALSKLEAEVEQWRDRSNHYQRERAELFDKLQGHPCAEIRWQQEKEALEAERDALRKALIDISDITDRCEEFLTEKDGRK
jgi:chromosome segregation ATPase